MKHNYLFTSESVSRGHPDKICDQISDELLDLFLTKQHDARVAIEAMVTPNKVFIAGEVRGPEIQNDILENVVRQKIRDIGYEQKNFHWQDLECEIRLNQQSPDISLGVDSSITKDEGAGDQGLMFGFAVNETPELMPAPIFYSHLVLRNIFDAIDNGELKGLGPDAKSQVTLEYQDGIPVRVDSVLVSIQHASEYNQQQVKDLIRPYVVSAFPNSDWMCGDEGFLVNPTGRFIIGGPESDTGLTGRKIIVDTYGGAAPHGGGAFSGKDPTKVDRSAAYMARYLAKNVVASGIAHKCTIQLAYAIGIARPMSFYINTHNTSEVSNKEIADFLINNIDLRPQAIREYLKLNNPIYSKTATYGHFGRPFEETGHFSWEKTDFAKNLKQKLS